MSSKMPLLSKKQKLIRKICQDAIVEVVITDSEDDQIFNNALEDLVVVVSRRCSVPRLIVPKSEEWFRKILPNYSDDHFKIFMRVSRQNFGRILQMIQNSEVFQGKNSKKQMDIDQQLALTLHKLGNDGSGGGIMNTAALFGVGGGGSVMKVVTRVLKAILELEHDWIKWPSNDERDEITRYMADRLPNCVGYIDGSHITLDEAPLDDPESYFTRKQRYAIQVQAICDNNLLIRNLFIGYAGSVHDARVFANSEIGLFVAKIK